jgi:uncharacterized protein (TIGR03086 family)
MTELVDLQPAARRMARLVDGTPEEALTRPTPCDRYTVGDLLDHIGGAAVAFRAGAIKEPLEGAASGDAANLGPDWRARVQRDLDALSDAWRDPAAWEGMTRVGGVDLPGHIAGVIALDELVIHGWDLAKATGQDEGYDGPGLDAVFAQVQNARGMGIEGLFGPEVEVPGDAPLLDRVLGASGRDPRWTPGAG